MSENAHEHEHAERQAVPTFDLGSETLEGIGDAGQDLLPQTGDDPDGPSAEDRWRERRAAGTDPQPE
jgi:hypothetical protein